MTIREIAQLAGVSSAAVSRYLNGGYVSGEKKERIKKVIQETGYQPSMQARTLRTKKACLVGVVVPKINSESISRVTEGVGQSGLYRCYTGRQGGRRRKRGRLLCRPEGRRAGTGGRLQWMERRFCRLLSRG